MRDELGRPFALWPPVERRITRVLDSPRDWQDHPRSVQVSGWRVKTGAFPRDDTNALGLSLLNRRRRWITVIPAEAPLSKARAILDQVTGVESESPSNARAEGESGWDNDGGHL